MRTEAHARRTVRPRLSTRLETRLSFWIAFIALIAASGAFAIGVSSAPIGAYLFGGAGSNISVHEAEAKPEGVTEPALPLTPLGTPRSYHTATALADGRVLVAGGDAVGSAEVYDPATDLFVAAGNLNAPRAGHASARLADGRVLVTGGTVGGAAASSTEIFDPSTSTFSPGPAMTSSRSGHTATRLANGSILIAGGGSDSVEVFDGSSFTAVAASMGAARTNASAALLADGRVFIAGGDGLASAEIFDSGNASFTPAGGAMVMARSRALLRLLPDGKMQIIGGNSDGSMEVYDPSIDTIGAYAHVVPATDPCANLINYVLAAETRAALIFNGSSAPDRDRRGHTITELGSSAIVIGGTDSADNALASTVVYNSSNATVTTDKLDYSPGQTVQVTGTGYAAGETVRVMIHEDPHTPQERGFDAVADDNGNFIGTYLVQDYDLAMKFVVGARGLASGKTAQTTFTDGNNSVSGTVKSAAVGNPAIVGALIQCTLNCNSPASTTSLAGGLFSLSFNYAGNGPINITFTVSAPGYVTNQFTLFNVINAPPPSVANVLLTPVVRLSSTSLACAPTPISVGGSTTCTATIQDISGGTPSPPVGSVLFGTSGPGGFSPASSCTVSPINASQSSCSLTYTAFQRGTGTHNISATYLGSSPHNGSTASPFPLTVNKANTTTAITSDIPEPSVVGQAVIVNFSVTATVATGTAAITGIVNVSASTGEVCPPVPVGAGTCSITFNSVGPRTITAMYTGDSNYNLSSSSPVTPHQVNQASTTTTLTSDHLNPLAWTQITPTGTGPSASTCAQTTHPDGAGRLIVYARSVCGGGVGEVWVLNNANGIGSPAWSLVSSGGPSRHGQTTVYDQAGNNFILFGGCSGGCLPVNNDVWVLTNANGQGGPAVWTQITGITGGPPAARNHAAGAYDPVSNRLMIYGGQNGSGVVVGATFSDVWVLTNANTAAGSHTWSSLATSGTFPKGVYQPRAFYDSANNRLTVAGGARSDTGAASSAVNVLTNANGTGGTPAWTNLIAEGAPGAPAFAGWNTTQDTAANRGILAQQSSSNLYYLNNVNGLGSPTSYTLLSPSGGGGATPGYGLGFDAASGRTMAWHQGGGTNQSYYLAPASASVYGESVIFTSTVTVNAPGSGTPTGTVQFFVNGVTPIGGPQPVVSGTASVNTTTLIVGLHNITAVYSGNTNFNGSASGALTHTVSKAATTTTVLSLPNPSTYGDSVTFTSTTLSGGSPVGEGAVSFYDGGTCAAPGTLLAAAAAVQSLTGEAGFSVSTLTAGSHTVIACYTGTNYSDSNGGVLHVVDKRSLTVTADDQTITYGDADPAFTFQYGGEFVLGDDAADIDVAPTCTVSGPHANAGSYPIVCSGGSDDNYEFSFVAGTLTIDKAATTTVITCPTNVTYTGFAIEPCTALVTGPNLSEPVPVTYMNNINAGLATASATYAESANHLSSSDSENFTIDKAATTTVITCPTNVTYTGFAIEPCTAMVTGPNLNEPVAVTYANNINAGPATASATYAESANHLGSSDSENFTIDKAATTTVITCPTNVTYTGLAQEPCSATVTGPNLSEPVAVTYANNINAGPATANATYAESANHFGSSDSENFTIDKAATTTVITCPTNVTYTGLALEPCSATVTGPNLSESVAVTYANNINAGLATANATYAESANHLGSSDSENFTIDKAATITVVSCPTNVTYTGFAIEPCTSMVMGPNLSEAVAVTYANNINAGPATANATYAESANHLGSSDSENFTIDKAATTTVITCPTNVTYTGLALEPCTAMVTGPNLSEAVAVTYANNINSGLATANATYAESANHLGSSDSENFTIDKAATITVLSCPTNVTYTGSAIEPCTAMVTGPNLNEAVAVTYMSNMNAGLATANATYAESANHLGSSDSENFTIDKAATITVVSCPTNVTYIGSAIEPCTAMVTGPNLNEAVAVTYANNINAGPATANATYAESANHLGSSDSENFTIDKAATTTVVTCPASVTYTGSPIEPCTAEVVGPNLSESLMVTYMSNVNAGMATASAAYAESANHLGSSDSETFTIDKAATTTVITCPTNVTYTGMAIEPCTVLVTGPNLSLTPAPVYVNNVNAGTANASYTYAESANHLSSTDSQDFTIDKRMATWTTNPGSKTYGDPDPMPMTTGSGANFVDPVTATYARVGGENASPPTYHISATLSAAPGVLDNYIITNDGAEFTINKRSLIITAQTNTKTYNGDTDAAAVPSVSGLQFMDSVTGLTETYDNRNAGSGKTLSVATYTVDDGNGGNNYDVSTVDDTTGVIEQAELTITAVPNTKPYDGTTTAAGIPSVGGLISPDTVTGLSETYDTKHAGTGKTMSVATFSVNDGNSGANYIVNTVQNMHGVINQAALTITAVTNTKTYDGTISAAATPTVSGTQTGDTVTGLSETYDTKHFGSGKTLSVTTYAVNDGNGGNNYIVSTVPNNTGVINKLAITVTAVTATKSFDGNTSSSGIPTVAPPLVGGDTPNFIQTYDTPWVGTGKTLTPSGTANDGNVGLNYSYTFAPVNTGVITTIYCFNGYHSPIGGSVEGGNGGSFNDPLRAFKLNSTIPIKFTLYAVSCSGTPITTGTHTLSMTKYSNAVDSEPAIDATPTDGATTGNQFRLTGTDWHFNLDTKRTPGVTAGTWLVKATLSDGSTKTVWISIKK